MSVYLSQTTLNISVFSCQTYQKDGASLLVRYQLHTATRSLQSLQHSIPSDDTQIIPEDESLKDTTSQSLSNTHSQIILEDSQIIPGLFHDYSLPVSQPLSQPPSLPDSETLSQIIPDSLSVSPEEEPAEVSQYNPEEETIPEQERKFQS